LAFSHFLGVAGHWMAHADYQAAFASNIFLYNYLRFWILGNNEFF